MAESHNIAKRFPSAGKNYVNYKRKELGEVCFSKTSTYSIAHCFSQTFDFNTDYQALERCLDKIVLFMHEHHLSSIAIPYKYGCGIAHGDWNKVLPIFIKKLTGFILKIYRLS